MTPLRRAQHTYLADDASLEGATLETRQKQSSGLTGGGSSSASEESDSVETHDDFVFGLRFEMRFRVQ